MAETHSNQDYAPELPGAFSLFRPSYEALLVNIWTFLGLFGIPMSLLIIAGIFGNILNNSHLPANSPLGLAALGLVIVALVLAVIGAASTPYLQLKSAKQEPVSLGEALGVGVKYFWRFWGITLLVGLIILGGFLLFFVPGLFMLRRYILAPFYLYDKKLSIMDSLRRSAKDSKKFSASIWGLIGVTLLIGLPSLFPVIVLISLVLQLAYYCAPAIRYLQIQQAKKH